MGDLRSLGFRACRLCSTALTAAPSGVCRLCQITRPAEAAQMEEIARREQLRARGVQV